MKAVVVHSYGGPEVLKWQEAPDPVAGPGEVVVRVAATSVNPFDLHMRSGAVKEVAPIAFPGVIGLDVSGTVQALGQGVTEFAVGDEVFAKADSAYAELCVIPVAALAKIPAGMNLVEAAALPVVTITGNMLGSATGAGAGQTVLVTGAAGSVGRSAVYTVKQRGAHVIAAVLTSQLDTAASLGADEAVATDSADALAKLPALDAVADTVGGKTAEALIGKVKQGGTFASVLGAPANADSYPNVHVEAVYAVSDGKILATMADAVESGALVIPVSLRMPLSQAAEAHDAVARGEAHGKVLLVADAGDPARSASEEAIRTLLRTYNAALNGSDTEAVLPLYTKDGIFMAPFSPSAIGHESIRKAYDHVFETLKFNVVFHVVELVVRNDGWAYGRTESAGNTTNPATGKQSSEGNQELFVFRKDADDAWKIARYSFSPINPPKP